MCLEHTGGGDQSKSSRSKVSRREKAIETRLQTGSIRSRVHIYATMLVFLHIPKTAGTTFQFILENNFGMNHCHLGHMCTPLIDQRDLGFMRKFFPCLRSMAGENLSDPLRLSMPDPFYITFLREPVARVFSHYQDDALRAGNKLGFEERLRSEELLQNLQVKFLAGRPDLDRARKVLEQFNFVGLVEKFDLSLHVLEKLSPRKLKPNYVRRLTARDNAIKQTLEQDQRMIDLAREYNQLDVQLYEFARSEIFPGLCARAGCSPEDKVGSYKTFTSRHHLIFLLHRFYNQFLFRRVCKIYRRYRGSQPA